MLPDAAFQDRMNGTTEVFGSRQGEIMKSNSNLSESNDYRRESDYISHSKKKSDFATWRGTCLHIILELAECGDVQNVSNLSLPS